MNARVLFVDDDVNALSGYQRVLRKAFDVHVAAGGAAGLVALRASEPFAAIVSDMRMPEMDGIEFLARVRDIAPETTRVMLTGDDGQRTAADAVNRGAIFRFLAKPCAADALAEAVAAAVRQYRLVTAERELLEKTIGGGIRVLTEVLAVVDPESFGRGGAIRDLARALCAGIGATPSWELDAAALLASIGSITIPPSVLVKSRGGQVLNGPEQDMLSRAPQAGAQLLANIPRLEGVARVVLYQGKHWDGGGFPIDGVAGDAIPLEARLLRVAIDMVAGAGGSRDPRRTIAVLRERAGVYDPSILAAAEALLPPREPAGTREITVGQLRDGMLLAGPILHRDDQVLIGAGQRVTRALIERVRNMHRLMRVKEPLLIHVEDEA
ncbi:MAG TPA: HD domain-containing phosphohydrolase [Planctomycetota bacterium]|nr:HD domain-containing phosphohydrolase [Planctomycetota bacterium]